MAYVIYASDVKGREKRITIIAGIGKRKDRFDRFAETFAPTARIVIATRSSATLPLLVTHVVPTSCRARCRAIKVNHSVGAAANEKYAKRSAFKTNVHWPRWRTASPKRRPAPRRTTRVGALTRDHCCLLPAAELSPFANSRIQFMIFNWRRCKELINATLHGDLFTVTLYPISPLY